MAGDGDLAQYQLGHANALGNNYFDPGIEPTTGAMTRSGLVAFLFPLNTAKGTP